MKFSFTLIFVSTLLAGITTVTASPLDFIDELQIKARNPGVQPAPAPAPAPQPKPKPAVTCRMRTIDKTRACDAAGCAEEGGRCRPHPTSGKCQLVTSSGSAAYTSGKCFGCGCKKA